MWRSGMYFLAVFSALLLCARAQVSSDRCDWTGSGLTHESREREVEQVYLRCAEGSLEWLYPSGAVIINLRPNLMSFGGHIQACVKPRIDSRGAVVYVERAGKLKLLLSEEDQAAGHVRCFDLQQGALFMEASAQRDLSKRITAFQYQLISSNTHTDWPPISSTDPCRSCSDDQLLMAVCTSDFVVRGSVEHVEEEEDDEGNVSALLRLSRVYRQKTGVFVWAGGGRRPGRWTGQVRIRFSCGARASQEEFLFTGALRFGEARLKCAARYHEFKRLYQSSVMRRANHCHIHTD